MALSQSAFALAPYYYAFVRLEENGYLCLFFFSGVLQTNVKI